MTKYSITQNPGSSAMDVSFVLSDSENNVLATGKYDAASLKSEVVKGLMLGGMNNFKIMAPDGTMIGYAQASLGLPKHLEVYAEPNHNLLVSISVQFAITTDWGIFGSAGEKLWDIKGSMNPLKMMVHTIHDANGGAEIGSFTVDLKEKKHYIDCSDERFTPVVALGLWLLLSNDMHSGKGGIF